MRRRRRFTSWFVEPYRQVKLGLMFLIVNLVFSFLILGVFGFYLWDVYQAIVVYFQLSGAQGLEIMGKLTYPLIWGTALMVLFIGTTLLVSVRYTHAIYGPLVSIHRYLDDLLNQRRVQPLNLRESDQLKDLADRLNLLAERYISDQRHAPMVPIHRFLDDLIQGRQPKPLELRDTDQFKDLVGKLNKVADMVNAKQAGKPGPAGSNS